MAMLSTIRESEVTRKYRRSVYPLHFPSRGFLLDKMSIIEIYYLDISEVSMISEQLIISDYDTPHPHIVYAKHLEKHLDMFGIFKIQNDQMIILCYSAAVSLALSGQAMFQYTDLERILGHIEKDTRTKIIHYLKKHKWLVDNITSYELSEAARKFLNFASGPLPANDLSLSQELNISRKQAELSDDYNLDEEQSMKLFKRMKRAS